MIANLIDWMRENIDDENLVNLVEERMIAATDFTNPDFSVKRIIRIDIAPSGTRDVYPGCKEETGEKLVIFQGPANSGKTSTYDKFHHLFVRHNFPISKVNRWKTKITIIFEVVKASLPKKLYRLTVEYQSSPSTFFEVTISSMEGIKKLTSQDLPSYLTKNGIIATPLCFSKFVGTRNDIIPIFASTPKLMEFLRPIEVSSLVSFLEECRKNEDLVNKRKIHEKNEKLKTLKIIEDMISTLEKEREKIEKILLSKQEVQSIRQEISENKTDLPELEEIRKEIKSLGRKKENANELRQNLKKEIDRLKKIKESQKSFEMLFIEDRPLICLNCDQPIPTDKSVTYIKRKKCYICGQGDMEAFYKSERQSFFLETNDEQLDLLTEQLRSVDSEIEEYEGKLSYLRKKLTKQGKISTDSLYFASTYSESDFENFLAEKQSKQEDIKKRIVNFTNEKSRVEGEIRRLQQELNSSIERVNAIKTTLRYIKQLLEEDIAKDINFLIDRINYYFTRYAGDTIGLVDFFDNELVFVQVFGREEANNVERSNLKRVSPLSETSKRKLELAFALASQDYILHKQLNEIKVIFIDSFDSFSDRTQGLIMEDLLALANNGYQCFIFTKKLINAVKEMIGSTNLISLGLNSSLRKPIPPKRLDTYLLSTYSNES